MFKKRLEDYVMYNRFINKNFDKKQSLALTAMKEGIRLQRELTRKGFPVGYVEQKAVHKKVAEETVYDMDRSHFGQAGYNAREVFPETNVVVPTANREDLVAVACEAIQFGYSDESRFSLYTSPMKKPGEGSRPGHRLEVASNHVVGLNIDVVNTAEESTLDVARDVLMSIPEYLGLAKRYIWTPQTNTNSTDEA